MHVDEHVVGCVAQAVQCGVDLREGGPAGLHEEVAGQVHDPEPHAVALDDAAAVARLTAEEVRRPQDPLLAVEVRVDLALAVGVVAERDHVDSMREQLVGDLRRDADAASYVLAVDDDEVERMTLAQFGQKGEQQSSSDTADEVADEQDRNGTGHAPPGSVLFLLGVPRGNAVNDPHSTDEPLATVEAPVVEDAHPTPPPGVPAPVVVPRGIQLVLLGIGLLALWALAQAAGGVLLIFVIAGVIALILNPLVKFIERSGLPHSAAVFAVYIGLLAVLVGLGGLLANPVAHQVESFQRDVPKLTRDATHSLDDVQRWLDARGLNVQVRKQGQTALQTIEGKVVRGSGDLVTFTRDLLQQIVQTGFALILILVISIYMLVYAESIGKLVRSVMPSGDGSPEDDYPSRVQKAVSSYVRGQLLFSIIMGATASLALWVFGVLGIFPDGGRYALAFGAFFGVMELIPYVGPILGALPPILVALFDDPLTAVWVALLFLGIQQLEGHIVAPQVFGHSLRINPLLIIFALLFGAEVYGIVGALVALPVAAILRETVVHLRRHVVLEPWTRAPG